MEFTGRIKFHIWGFKPIPPPLLQSTEPRVSQWASWAAWGLNTLDFRARGTAGAAAPGRPDTPAPPRRRADPAGKGHTSRMFSPRRLSGPAPPPSLSCASLAFLSPNPTQTHPQHAPGIKGFFARPSGDIPAGGSAAGWRPRRGVQAPSGDLPSHPPCPRARAAGGGARRRPLGGGRLSLGAGGPSPPASAWREVEGNRNMS